MYKDLIYILENNIMPQLRKSGVVNSVTTSGENYVLTVNATTDIEVNDIINLKDASDNDIEARVLSFIEDTSITVKTKDAAIPVDDSWNALKPYFSFEKWQAEANMLQLMTDKIIAQHKKYPLIFLLLDLDEDRETSIEYDIAYNNVKLFIINGTNNGSGVYAEDRRNENFIPTLYPIYNNLLSEMKSNGNIMSEGNRIPHTKIDRYFLGTADQNQNKLNDYVDAIELTFNEIKLQNTNTNC